MLTAAVRVSVGTAPAALVARAKSLPQFVVEVVPPVLLTQYASRFERVFSSATGTLVFALAPVPVKGFDWMVGCA
jgi:hypothetical protein